jgi:hypothetical protein
VPVGAAGGWAEPAELITCNANNGKVLSPKYLHLGYAEATKFNLSIAQEYEVFAISIWRGALFYLVSDDTHLPMWQPVELFELSDGRLSRDWLFSRKTAAENGVEALWGYERLIEDAGHYEALLERDPEALRYFYRLAGAISMKE